MIAQPLIDWLFDGAMLDIGLLHYIAWLWKHTLICGKTGSGKSVALLLLLAKIAKYAPDTLAYFLDYKAQFKGLAGTTRYFAFKDCDAGMEAFQQEFEARQGDNPATTPLLLVCDEWGAFANSSQEKKLNDKRKAMLDEYASLGRSMNVTVIIGIQRPDIANYFTSGATRDQFNCVLNLNKVTSGAKNMLFPDNKDDIDVEVGVAQGYFEQAGKFYRVDVPEVHDEAAMLTAIREILG